MKLFQIAVFCAALALGLAQLPTFRYNQQFGQGAVAVGSPILTGFDSQRMFRLQPVPVQVVQEAVVFPKPGIIAPLPVVRALNTPTPVPLIAPLPAAPAVPVVPVVRKEPEHVNVPVPKVRRVVKKVRLQEKQPSETINYPENALPLSAKNEETSSINQENRLREEEENKNAHYSFSSSVQDSINDHAIQRSETRDGLSLTGMYSYSDGFFKRTIHYKADQDGYRVVKEEIEPIGQGPVFNPQGKADVESSLSGRYSITADDINLPKRTAVKTTTFA